MLCAFEGHKLVRRVHHGLERCEGNPAAGGGCGRRGAHPLKEALPHGGVHEDGQRHVERRPAGLRAATPHSRKGPARVLGLRGCLGDGRSGGRPGLRGELLQGGHPPGPQPIVQSPAVEGSQGGLLLAPLPLVLAEGPAAQLEAPGCTLRVGIVLPRQVELQHPPDLLNVITHHGLPPRHAAGNEPRHAVVHVPLTGRGSLLQQQRHSVGRKPRVRGQRRLKARDQLGAGDCLRHPPWRVVGDGKVAGDARVELRPLLSIGVWVGCAKWGVEGGEVADTVEGNQ
mmetsp:Transcript_31859/g.90491  ORF Transcript_31859/g.90491 Transcript_31859/m.90491 type:complete len:284 (-) Transcript_31859:296-1147(-)